MREAECGGPDLDQASDREGRIVEMEDPVSHLHRGRGQRRQFGCSEPEGARHCDGSAADDPDTPPVEIEVDRVPSTVEDPYRTVRCRREAVLDAW